MFRGFERTCHRYPCASQAVKHPPISGVNLAALDPREAKGHTSKTRTTSSEPALSGQAEWLRNSTQHSEIPSPCAASARSKKVAVSMTTSATLLQHASHAQTGNMYSDAARALQVKSRLPFLGSDQYSHAQCQTNIIRFIR